jgi:16S rRNA (guanine966-N2)-methyltransferase
MAEGKSGPRGRPATHRRGSQARTLRIIGGTWRGRKLRFPDAEAIRPTPDRVRETLFNWIGPRAVGARGLDLFAGSGALGLELISRGASSVVFVERDAVAARELRNLLTTWGAAGAQVDQADAVRWLSTHARPFDIVFLDPPFAAGLLEEVAQKLESGGWLAPHALIYVESPARDELPPVPAAWKVLKSKRAGEVGYHLLERAAAEGSWSE